MSDEPNLKQRARAVIRRGAALKDRWESSSWGRGAKRFSLQNGNVLSAGIAYFSLASIAAGLVIATAVATVFLGNDPELRATVADYLGSAVPGLVETGGSAGIIAPEDFGTVGAGVSAGVAGAVSLLILANTATRFVAGLRTSVRTMLGQEAANPVSGKLRDFAALVGLVVIALAGLGIQVVASSAAETIAALGGLDVPTWGLRAIATAGGVMADMLYVALVLVVLGGARWSRRLRRVAMVAGVGIGILRAAVSLVVGGTTDNAVLAPFAAIITLMIFVDYVNRIILVCAAWMGAHVHPPGVGRLVAGAAAGRVGPRDTGAAARTVAAGDAGRRRTGVTTARATVRDRDDA